MPRPGIGLATAWPAATVSICWKDTITPHLGASILASSALSFIGLGAQPPDAEWGSMIGAGREYVLGHWWYVTIPGVVIILTASSFNLLGDALRDWLDPRLARDKA